MSCSGQHHSITRSHAGSAAADRLCPQALLSAVAAKAPAAEVRDLIQKLRDAEPGIPKPAQSSAFTGSWELLWDYSVRASSNALLHLHTCGWRPATQSQLAIASLTGAAHPG